ncbi:MAG: hypothetical protein K0Q79_1438 [Flavipsychrobacter sp.]|jgi:hypothetical protein|nr:hypothetical protein [Flavipsychrobacter sp.]
MLRLVVLLLLSFTLSPTYAQTDSTGPQFNFCNKDRVHDFGSILINGNAEYKFEFKNSGNQPLIIKEMRSVVRGINTPPYKVLINYPKGPVQPGKNGTITALVVAQANTGPFKCEVLVISNVTTPNYPLLLLTGAIVLDHNNTTPAKTEPIPVQFLEPVIPANTK